MPVPWYGAVSSPSQLSDALLPYHVAAGDGVRDASVLYIRSPDGCKRHFRPADEVHPGEPELEALCLCLCRNDFGRVGRLGVTIPALRLASQGMSVFYTYNIFIFMILCSSKSITGAGSLAQKTPALSALHNVLSRACASPPWYVPAQRSSRASTSRSSRLIGERVVC